MVFIKYLVLVMKVIELLTILFVIVLELEDEHKMLINGLRLTSCAVKRLQKHLKAISNYATSRCIYCIY